MKVFICTTGTSIATNKRIDISSISNVPYSKRGELDFHITAFRQQMEEAFSRFDIKKNLDKTSAEIKSLAKMGVEKGDRVYFLVSDTIDGVVCAELNKKFIIKNWDCDVILEKIDGLQSTDSMIFRQKGLKNLLEKLIHILEKHQYQDACLNITAGYKSVVPYITILGMIHDKPVKYIYEKSNEIITLDKIPIRYDEEAIMEVEEKLSLIDNETEIKLELWEKGIPFEKREKYASLIQESNPGFVTISAIGLIFFEKYKTDFPPEIERDFTSPEKKSINLGNHHGKDKLMDFSKKILKSPFVKKVINSLQYNPKQRNPVKQCYDDGRIELILTDTDEGLGLIIQSTGKNEKQTKIIADKLVEKYIR